MPANLIIEPEAEKDIDLGYAWYESQRTGLGRRFIAAVKASIQALCRSPKVGRVVRGPYRRAVVHGWPYVVVYEYDEPNDTVIVHIVFHTSQDPAKWQQRLP
jgi:toxin ParE1/3/4